MSLKKFLAKHSGELKTVASVLGTIIGALPIDRQDKRAVAGAIDGLVDAANSIANSAEKMREVGDVTLDSGALKGALRELLPEITEAVFKLAKERDEPPAPSEGPTETNAPRQRKRTPGAKPTAPRARPGKRNS
jgi:hypothetical protein